MAQNPGKLLLFRLFFRCVCVVDQRLQHPVFLLGKRVAAHNHVFLAADIVGAQIAQDRPHPRVERVRVLQRVE